VPRTDATWFRPGTRTLDPDETPRPSRTLREEIRADFADVREEWQDLIAEIREHRQLIRRMHQGIIGQANPTRQEIRQAERVILSEIEELQAIARQVIAEHSQRDRDQPGD
jgi:hypothetical protein